MKKIYSIFYPMENLFLFYYGHWKYRGWKSSAKAPQATQ